MDSPLTDWLTHRQLAFLTFDASCRPLIKKLLLQNILFSSRIPKLIFKTGNGIIQKRIKNFFFTISLHIYHGIENLFPKQDMKLSKQEMELFLPLLGSGQKTSYTTSSSYLPRRLKLIYKTGNGIIQTGNRIISPTSRPLIEIPLLPNVSHLVQGV